MKDTTISSNIRIINGEEFSVEHLRTLEYNGEWVIGTYLVTRKSTGIMREFFSYPFDDEIKNFFDIK